MGSESRGLSFPSLLVASIPRDERAWYLALKCQLQRFHRGFKGNWELP